MDKTTLLYKVRHSTAHLLAQALVELYPDVKLTIGPATETGFFYDFQSETQISEKDLPTIEAKMREITKRKLEIAGGQISKSEALELYKNNKFKTEIINSIPGETVGLWRQGDFADLCEGGHVESTNQLKHFKLMRVAGSYWRADKNKAALQRISGIAFETKDALYKYVKMLEEGKKYDHRNVGKQLDLFSFHEESPGMPFFHNKGRIIFDLLVNYLRDKQTKLGYQEIKTPGLLNEEMWKQSGHYENYRENMYFSQVEGDDHRFALKPMNCPCGILFYKCRPHSYREFPLKIAEFGQVHRYELSGVLHGLFRVRAFTQDDAHVFCTADQIQQEVEAVLDLAEEVYSFFGFEKIEIKLSTKPEKSIGSDQLWDTATKALEAALVAKGKEFTINEGEGAFYGPKIELIFEDSIGRKWQCGTVQLDFFLPEKFDLTYIDSDQSRKVPVMIHRAIYGSMERFMGILIEHYKGRFPLWLAPVQARVLTISDEQSDYGKQVYTKLEDAGLRVEQDFSGDKISAQIRRAQLDQVPWMLVIGGKEAEAGTVTLRTLDGKQEFGITVDELISRKPAA